MSNSSHTLLIITKDCSENKRKSTFFTDESRTVYIPQVSVEDNNLLTALYSEDKVKKGWNTTKH
jgi:hypothetical protein